LSIATPQFSNLRVWLVAIAEGFSTLAVEVIAIRLAIPVVGSSLTLTGVMLGVVLLALSAGYWRGGELSSRWDKPRVRRTLTRNLLVGAIFYAAFSFLAEAWLLETFLDLGLSLAPAIGLAALLLLAFPVYFVAQSVPLLAELTNDEGKAGKASGKVLFFSTLGSVAGCIVTPLWLFPWLGVSRTTWVVCGLLVAAAVLMGTSTIERIQTVAFSLVALLSANLLAFYVRPANELYSFDSEYQTIRVFHDKDETGRLVRIMMLNGGRASGVYADSGASAFSYIRETSKALAAAPTDRVLAIGAAGFTFPRDAAAQSYVRQVDAVDVDPTVRRIAEQHFLLQPLPSKIRFFPQSARWALRGFRSARAQYGLAFLDAYSGKGIPDELLTLEFFRDVKAVATHTIANVIMDREVESAFSHNVLMTFRQVYGRVFVKDVDPGESDFTNYLVASWLPSGPGLDGWHEWTGSGVLYTDDRNTADHDHTRMVWSSD
jgi:spermidine synthase